MPVLDPLQLARDGCAAHFEAQGARHTAKDFREGRRDGCVPMQIAEVAVRGALEAAAAAVDREAAWYGRQYAVTFSPANTDADEYSRDRIAARARATGQAAAVIRGEFEGWSAGERVYPAETGTLRLGSSNEQGDDVAPEPSCNGRWGTCPNAYETLETEGNMPGAPIMRCRLTGKHPDECGAAAVVHVALAGNSAPPSDPGEATGEYQPFRASDTWASYPDDGALRPGVVLPTGPITWGEPKLPGINRVADVPALIRPDCEGAARVTQRR